MRVRRLDHVLLAMPAGREGEARQFYQGVLGNPGGSQARRSRGARRLLVRGWRAENSPRGRKDFVPARKAHPAFIVDDLAGLEAALKAAGYPVAHDEPLEGYDRLFVNDPFGNRIELMQVKA